jgi:CIC family chloride channel protein
MTIERPSSNISAFRLVRALSRLERVRLRRQLRQSGIVLVLAGAVVGAAAGLAAALMISASERLRRILFGLGPNVRLSALAVLPVLQTLITLAIGGLLLGVTIWIWQKRARDIVDPIEANALHGGRMSMSDSLFVALQSVISSGFGLSLGIEGGFTQMAGAIGSKIALALKRRRFDVRMLVGAGAASGIAGAFDAPIAGAAYGFELIVGSYSVAVLAPVTAAAVSGAFAANMLVGHHYRIPLDVWRLSADSDVLGAAVVGLICGTLAIGLMRGVTSTERIANMTGLRSELRPLFGGLLVATLALMVPHVLGSGRGAMSAVLQAGFPITLLAAVLLAKIAASAISIGSGFRGGLFSTSLFLGTVTGALIGEIGLRAGFVTGADVGLLSLVGMASFGSAVVGAPMTMALLAIEITENISVVTQVLVGVIAASLVARQAFGYSFATWRFHLRGEAILGGEDIGWTRELTARDLMRKDVLVVPASMPIDEFMRRYPAGTSKYVAAVDDTGAFIGLVDVAGLFTDHRSSADDESEPEMLFRALIHSDAWVAAGTSIDQLLEAFEQRETEILVVVDRSDSKHVQGLLTEAFVLRRYRIELEARQKEIFGY